MGCKAAIDADDYLENLEREERGTASEPAMAESDD
jgi:hypothetical protein